MVESVEFHVAHNGRLVEPDIVCDVFETALGVVVEQLVPHPEAFAALV
jgi:hypothetical protein